MITARYMLFFLFVVSASNAVSNSVLLLDDALKRVSATHPELGAARENVDAEKSAITFNQSPRDLMFGIMHEQNQNFMQQQMGPMTSLSLTQDIEFPAKYYYRGRIQASRVDQAQASLNQAQLALRRKVITTYFHLYANQHIKELLEAQSDLLRQVARIAEARHSTGAVSQQDEMKAHVEQTTVANELFEIQLETDSLQAKMSLLLGNEHTVHFSIPSSGLVIPESKLTENIVDVVLTNSSRVKQAQITINEVNLQKTLAMFNYAPDFRISGRTMIGANRPDNNFAIGVELSLPLWFFMSQNSEVNTASARTREARYNLEKIRRELISDTQEIASKIRNHQNLIKVFSSTLLPQAESTLNASRAAYQTGKSTFLELLDSARSVYAIRAAYYRHIAEYVEQLVMLEELAGKSLSSLPFGDSK